MIRVLSARCCDGSGLTRRKLSTRLLNSGSRNRGNESDRILVHWSLASPEVARACAGSPVRAAIPAGGAAWWVQVPRDVSALRLTDPEAARGWRTKVRDQLTTTLDAGGHVAGFDKQNGYLVLPPEGDPFQ